MTTKMTGKEKFQMFDKRDSNFYDARIMSTPYLETHAPQDRESFHMILTHIVQKDPKYTEFYKKTPGLKLLDNSLFELKYALPPEQVIEAAQLVDADILVAPDVIKDGRQTIENAIEFVEQLKKLGYQDKYAVMAVPQGSTLEEWKAAYNVLSNMDGIDCIGLSIIGMITAMEDRTGTDDIVVNRTALIEVMEAEGWANTRKWHHLLGLGRGPFELESYEDYEWIRSNDSSNAWWHGYNGVVYNSVGELDEKLKLEVDFAAPVLPEMEPLINENFETQQDIVDSINSWRGLWKL